MLSVGWGAGNCGILGRDRVKGAEGGFPPGTWLHVSRQRQRREKRRQEFTGSGEGAAARREIGVWIPAAKVSPRAALESPPLPPNPLPRRDPGLRGCPRGVPVPPGCSSGVGAGSFVRSQTPKAERDRLSPEPPQIPGVWLGTLGVQVTAGGVAAALGVQKGQVAAPESKGWLEGPDGGS